jgi:hypothetical protein
MPSDPIHLDTNYLIAACCMEAKAALATSHRADFELFVAHGLVLA